MKKGLILLSGIFLLLGLSSPALAFNFQIAYTGDNIINTWYVIGNGVPEAISPGPNASDWRYADILSRELDPGTSYQIIWEVQDIVDDWSIAAFLGEVISTDDPMTLSSSATWEITTDNSYIGATWVPATEYGANGSIGIPWGTNVAGISTTAQWIWTDNTGITPPGTHGWQDFQTTDYHAFVRVTFDTTNPVPEPATMLLLASGLVGLVGFRRKFKKS